MKEAFHERKIYMCVATGVGTLLPLTVHCLIVCRMKHKMIERVHEAARDFRRATNRTMVNTTKRTIAENAAIEVQLSKMSEKTAEVHHDNKNLRRYVTVQKHQVCVTTANGLVA